MGIKKLLNKNFSLFALLITLFIAGFFYVYVFLFSNDIYYEKISERILDDGGENYLYDLESLKLENKYFLATDKTINNLNYISKDSFWNPRMCAQMKNIVTENGIVFFDTSVIPGEENPYVDLLHFYSKTKNSLVTLRAKTHINIYKVKKIDSSVFIYSTSEENKYSKWLLNLEKQKLEFICDENTCPDIKSEMNKVSSSSKKLTIKTNKPYGLEITSKEDDKRIFSLDKASQIYYYLIGE